MSKIEKQTKKEEKYKIQVEQLKKSWEWLNIDFDIPEQKDFDDYIEKLADKNNINIVLKNERKILLDTKKNRPELKIYMDDKFGNLLEKNAKFYNLKTLQPSLLKNKVPCAVFQKKFINSYGEIENNKFFRNTEHEDLKIFDVPPDATEKQMKQIMSKLVVDGNEIAKVFNFDVEQVGLSAVNINRYIITEYLSNIKLGDGLKFNDLDYEEFDIIRKASYGAIQFSIQGAKFKNCKSYDVNSSYGSTYINQEFKIPTQKGFMKTKDFNKNEYGFFQLEIPNKNISGCLFKFNNVDNDNWYCTQDLQVLDENKIAYVIQKSYTYKECDLISFDMIFGKVVRQFYELKKNGNKLASECLRSLWGMLTQSNYMTVETTPENKIKYGNYAIKISSEILCYDPERPYKHLFCRIKPFMLSFGRKRISKEAKKIFDLNFKIYRMHTDSIVSDIPENIFNDKVCKISKELGDFKIEDKYEKDKTYCIKNINNIVEVEELHFE